MRCLAILARPRRDTGVLRHPQHADPGSRTSDRRSGRGRGRLRTGTDEERAAALLFLARYMAASALSISSSPVAPSTGKTATPMLALTASVQSWRLARDIACDNRSSKRSRLGSPVIESCKARLRASLSSPWEIAKAARVVARVTRDSVNSISAWARSSTPCARISVNSWRSSAHSCTVPSTVVPANSVACAESMVVPTAMFAFMISLAVARSSAQVSTFAFTSRLCFNARSNASGASARPDSST